jgi:UDP-N-acetylmuramoylalanine--D-glutamate ligase
MRVAILGYGSQGKSAYEYWRKGNNITICSRRPIENSPEDVDIRTGDNLLKNLDTFDLIVRSPGLHPRVLVENNSPEILEKVTTNTNEFLRVCPTKHIIGVTGTKGKGTTSTMIARILEACGKRVHLGGNIGIPPLELLKNDIQPDDYVVLELANFQLIDLQYSPHIGVCVMVEPEHLDWHTDEAEYYHAKSNLFAHQTPTDIAIYYSDNETSHRIASASVGAKIPYFAEPGAVIKDGAIVIDDQEICKISELNIPGEHNWQNICGAVTAVWQIVQDVAAIRKAVIAFAGLPYRIEYRTEKHGIKYYNDSFAAAPGATIAAVRSIKEPKILIVGGHDRGLDLSELANTIADPAHTVASVLLIGQSADRMATALQKVGYDSYKLSTAVDMDTIVREATMLTQPGDAVVLSPGFPSFDMFKNFEDRGDQFNNMVEKL